MYVTFFFRLRLHFQARAHISDGHTPLKSVENKRLSFSATLFVLGVLVALPGCSGADNESGLSRQKVSEKFTKSADLCCSYADYVFPSSVQPAHSLFLDDIDLVRIQRREVTNADLDSILKMPNLVILDLRYSSINVEQIRRLQKLPRLQVLTLQGHTIVAELAVALSQMPNLEVLDISEATCAAEEILTISKSRTLREFVVSEAVVSDVRGVIGAVADRRMNVGVTLSHCYTIKCNKSFH